MAFLDPNTVIGLLQGKIGDLVFARTKEGRIIVRHRPVRTAEFTEGERAGQSQLVASNRYLQAVRQQPEIYALYRTAARVNGKRGCDLAKADYCHAPRITDIDLARYAGMPGDVVSVEATDDFEVVAVSLTFAMLDGTLLEHGAAVLDTAHGRWVYTAQFPMPPGDTIALHVTAADRPGNQVTRTLHYAIAP